MKVAEAEIAQRSRSIISWSYSLPGPREPIPAAPGGIGMVPRYTLKVDANGTSPQEAMRSPGKVVSFTMRSGCGDVGPPV